MSKAYDLAVLGGGVVGLSVAVQCAKLGWRVCVIDRQEVGKESSWAGAGILPAGASLPVDDPIESLRQLSDHLHEEWAVWLREYTQVDTEYRRSGGMYLARTAAERATLRGNCLWWQELGIGYERLTEKQVAERYPLIAPCSSPTSAVEFYWVPRDAKVRNPRHLKALKIACERLGVQILERTEVTGIVIGSNSIERLELACLDSSTSRIRFSADRYCITTGAWTTPLLESIGIKVGVYPVRGQMQLYRLAKSPFPFVLNEGHRYIVPREDGKVLVGSCEEEVGFHKGTTQEMMGQLREWALSVCPGLVDAQLELQWSGLRPGSFDAFPYLGTLYPYTNGYIAAGHFRHGLHWSTATAVLMQQHMSGQKPLIDLEPFRVQRGNA